MYMILLDASPANLECGKHSGKRMYRDDRNLGKLKHLVITCNTRDRASDDQRWGPYEAMANPIAKA